MTLKASPALGVCPADQSQKELCQARPALLQLFKTTNRPFAILSAAGLYQHLPMILQMIGPNSYTAFQHNLSFLSLLFLETPLNLPGPVSALP